MTSVDNKSDQNMITQPKLLGEGMYALVYSDGKSAIKTLKQNGISSKCVREISTLSLLNGCDGILRLNSFDVSPKGNVRIITELCEGTLFSEKFIDLDPKVFLDIMRQIIVGIYHAHSLGIIHRDIKPDNIFLSSDEKGKISVKIGDWGLARKNYNSVGICHSNNIQTRQYCAPEVLETKINNFRKVYDVSIDIWSIGVLFLEYMDKQCYFDEEDDEIRLSMYSKINRDIVQTVVSKFFGEINNEITDVIISMLNVNPEKRPSAEDLLKLPIFGGIVPPPFKTSMKISEDREIKNVKRNEMIDEIITICLDNTTEDLCIFLACRYLDEVLLSDDINIREDNLPYICSVLASSITDRYPVNDTDKVIDTEEYINVIRILGGKLYLPTAYEIWKKGDRDPEVLRGIIRALYVPRSFNSPENMYVLAQTLSDNSSQDTHVIKRFITCSGWNY